MKNFNPIQIATIVIAVILAQNSWCANMEIYKDSLAPGWNNMDSCTVFQINIDSSCSISWNVIKSKPNFDRKFFRDPQGLILIHHNNAWRKNSYCKLSFEQTKSKHAEILDSIFRRYPASRFGQFVDESFSSWGTQYFNHEIAVASLKDNEYQLFRRKHKISRYNAIRYFIKISNQSKVFEKIDSIFKPHGASLRMTSAEDLLESTVTNFPIKQELIQSGYRSKDYAIWDASNIGYNFNKSDTIQIELIGDKSTLKPDPMNE